MDSAKSLLWVGMITATTHADNLHDNYDGLSDFEPDSGCDIVIACTSNDKTRKFLLFAQIKQLFDSYKTYCTYKGKAVPKDHPWDGCHKGHFSSTIFNYYIL